MNDEDTKPEKRDDTPPEEAQERVEEKAKPRPESDMWEEFISHTAVYF